MPLTLSLSDLPSNDNTMASSIELRLFRYTDAEAFRCLNEAWIEKYFGIEEADQEVLHDPVGYILEPGGQIIIAALGDRIIGCCALKPMEPGIFEVAKMAVAEDLRGHGIGRRVLLRTIAEAKTMGATKLYLETNNRLENAIHLYESLGFRHLPPKHSPYARANVFMELRLA
jgi:GNAT superfamily N-acetyltransferase